MNLLFPFFNRTTCLNGKYTSTSATFVHIVWQNYETRSQITWSILVLGDVWKTSIFFNIYVFKENIDIYRCFRCFFPFFQNISYVKNAFKNQFSLENTIKIRPGFWIFWKIKYAIYFRKMYIQIHGVKRWERKNRIRNTNGLSIKS